MFRKIASRDSTPVKAKNEDGSATDETKESKPTPQRTASSTQKDGKLVRMNGYKEKFTAFQKTMKALNAALKKHHESLVQQRKTRGDVVKLVIEYVKDTPLDLKDEDRTFTTVYNDLVKKDISYEEQWEEKVVNYTAEWERLMTVKFTDNIKKVDEMRKSLDHYEKKVTTLRAANEKEQLKPKGVTEKATEKYDRNAQKLEEARREYERNEASLGGLFEEFIDRSWKDLYPMLIGMLDVDRDASQERAILLGGLKSVIDQLSTAAEKHNVELRTY